jgi:pseudouridine kinase
MFRSKFVTVIGASNVDITGFTKHKLVYQDANIGAMTTSPGGVGRNIAENLLHLDFEVKLVSVFGDDALSHFIVDSCRAKGLDIEASLFLEEASTATFLAIMDEHNDLALGISAMEIYDKVDVSFIEKKLELFRQSDYIVLETNMPEQVLQFVVNALPKSKFVLDTVSGKKALKSKAILSHLYILKTNLLEANMLSGLQVEDETDYPKLVYYFIEQGVKHVFITLGNKGVVFGNCKGVFHQPSIKTDIVNTIGAGDAFVSGIVYGESLGLPIEEVAKMGMLSASLTVQHDSAVTPMLNVAYLQKNIKNI